jgi:hypothetical protein
MRRLRFLFVALGLLAFAACNGGSGGPYTVPYPGTPLPGTPAAPATATPPATPTPPGTSTVSFLVIVPAPTNARTRPHVILPSNATSVKFTIDSVNGNAYSGTPTTEVLALTTSGCQSASSQLSCLFNLAAPIGTVIWTVTAYNGTTVIAEGNLSVTTTNGSTVSAPVTLTGTVAKIAVAVGAAVAGVSITVPITVQAEDANGYTILGTYTSPISLSDSDSTYTSIATSGSDGPHAGELLSSSDTATLTYNGGAMSTAATISASASGVSASNVTPATFLPVTNYYAQSGSISFGQTSYSSENYDAQATPLPSPSWNSYTSSPVPIATGQTFDGVSNAIGVNGLAATDSLSSCCYAYDTPAFYLSSSAITYYAWSAGNGEAALGLLGYSDPNNPYYENVLAASCCGLTELSLLQTCAPPYPQLFVVPLPASWNVFSGSGPCTTTFTDTEDDTDTYTYYANGSYTDSTNDPSGYNLPPGAASTTVDSAGDVTYTIDSPYGAGSMSVPAPSPEASMIPVSFTLPDPSVPFVPTPAPSTAPNPWAAIGLANGTIPNPLLQDTMTNKGAISSLPAMCAVPAGLVPSTNPPLTEVDETIVAADPMNNWLPFYLSQSIKHYYLNGVGEVCNENQSTGDYFDYEDYGDNWLWSFNYYLGGAIAWYAGVDTNYDSYYSDTYTYITETSLTAVDARVRDFAKSAPTAAQALTAMTYQLAHGSALVHRMTRARPKSRFIRRYK